MPKRYNTPHRSHVVKTRLTDEEYADFTERLAPYGISQSRISPAGHPAHYHTPRTPCVVSQ